MEQNPKTRVLFTPKGLKVREAQGEGNESRMLEGCAIVFNTPTVLYEDDEIIIREVILPTCATQAFLNSQDILLNLLHNRNDSLARSINGSGSLSVESREDGVYFEAEAPKCDIGERALALVKNGTYTGCSFEFLEGDYDREQNTLPDGKIDILYTHKTFNRISALTIAIQAAYPTTTVAAREKEIIKREQEAAKNVEAEKAKAEAEAKAQQEREAKEKAAAKRERVNALKAKADNILFA